MDDLFPINAERLQIRRMRIDDAPRFTAYRADAEFARYQSWRPMSKQDAERFISAMQDHPAFLEDSWLQIAIAQRPSDALIGDIGFCLHANGDLEIGFTLCRAAHGQSLATEALAALVWALLQRTDVKRIVGVVDARNEQSIRVLNCLGMEQVSSEDKMLKGESCTELRYQLENHYAAADRLDS